MGVTCHAHCETLQAEPQGIAWVWELFPYRAKKADKLRLPDARMDWCSPNSCRIDQAISHRD